MKTWVLALLLAGCSGGDNNSGDQCACTVTVTVGDAGTSGKLNLGCGEQGCIGGMSYGCEDDDVVPLGVCDQDMSVPPTRNDAGQAVCYPFSAACSTALPCCGVDAGVVATCDPVSKTCCVPTGSTCTTSADCCSGKTCIPSGGQAVCGS